nr:transporter substrate-binding domain-containing protein [Curtobacterium flaccumfaciens]
MSRTTPSRWRNRAGFLVLAAGVVVALAGCSAGASADTSGAPDGSVTIGAASNGAAEETTLEVTEDTKLHDALPAAVRKSGRLTIGVGALPAGFPPLAFTGDDQKTITGSEPDLGRLVAAKLGLRADVQNATWDNLFVGIDSGKYDAGFSNVTVTEERKEKYDFASYRQDNLAFQVPASSSLRFDGDPSVLAGKTLSVSSGTNQENILLEWQEELRAKGEDFTIKYYPDGNAIKLALDSGKIDSTHTSARTRRSPTRTRRARAPRSRRRPRARTPAPARHCRGSSPRRRSRAAGSRSPSRRRSTSSSRTAPTRSGSRPTTCRTRP